jgi:acetyl esterase/lipase
MKSIILIALIVVLVYPFISLGFKVYMNKILDRDINKEHYPEIYKKGIYEDNTPSPIEEIVSSYYGVNSTYQDLRNDPYLDMYFQHLCSYLPPKIKLKELRICQHGNEERTAIIDALNYLRSLVLEQQVSYLHKRHYSVLGLRQKERRKVAIVMGGGGYEYVSTLPEEFPVSTELHKKGLNVFSFVYPIKEDSKYANEVLKEFIHFLFKHQEKMNIDMEDYMVIGFSASGHLVASIATDNLGLVDVPKPKLIGLAYPVISMGDCTHVGSRENLLGKDSTQEERDEHSVELHVGKDFSSCFVWHLKGDTTVPFKNSLLLVEALEKQNIDYRLELFEGIEHGLGLGQNSAAENWLERLYQYYQELTELK